MSCRSRPRVKTFSDPQWQTHTLAEGHLSYVMTKQQLLLAHCLDRMLNTVMCCRVIWYFLTSKDCTPVCQRTLGEFPDPSKVPVTLTELELQLLGAGLVVITLHTM